MFEAYKDGTLELPISAARLPVVICCLLIRKVEYRSGNNDYSQPCSHVLLRSRDMSSKCPVRKGIAKMEQLDRIDDIGMATKIWKTRTTRLNEEKK